MLLQIAVCITIYIFIDGDNNFFTITQIFGIKINDTCHNHLMEEDKFIYTAEI